MYRGSYRAFASLVSQFGAWAVGMVFILVLGAWFMPWFSADEPVLADGSMSVKLIETEICHSVTRDCGTMQSSELNEGWVGDLPYAIAGAGLGFAVLVLRADRRRQTHGEIGWTAIWIIGAAVGITLLLIVVYLVKFDTGPVLYEIVDRGSSSYSFQRSQALEGVTGHPTLASGAFVTLAGLGLGCVAAWKARPIAEDLADEPAVEAAPKPTEPKRAPIEPPPRGVETDPFRALPAPPPIRVVQNVRPVATPRAEGKSDDNTPAPKLLR